MVKMDRPIRVLLTKPGIDTHWRGVAVLSMGLRDNGLEVINAGNQSVEEIVRTAVQEDVDILGLSFQCESYRMFVPAIMEGLKENEAEDMKVIVGGHILPNHDDSLIEAGVKRVFHLHTAPDEVAEYIKEIVK